MQFYTTSEIIALVLAVVIGSIAYLGVVWKDKPTKITFRYVIAVLSINSFFVWVASEFMRTKEWGMYRTVVLPAVAFLGQWIADYIKLRYPQIFDAGLKRAGLNLEKQENNEKIEDYKEGADTPAH